MNEEVIVEQQRNRPRGGWRREKIAPFHRGRNAPGRPAVSGGRLLAGAGLALPRLCGQEKCDCVS